MKLSDFNSLIELLTGLYFAFFGLKLAKTIASNKYSNFLSQKDSMRDFIESRSNILLVESEWEKFKKIKDFVKKIENHFDKSSEIFEEMFILSGLYGIIILFFTAFYNNCTSSIQIGNTSLLYANSVFIILVLIIFWKLFNEGTIIKYSTFRLVVFAFILCIIFLLSSFFNKFSFFNWLDTANSDWFIIMTIFNLFLSYVLFYIRWKQNTLSLYKQSNSIYELINEFNISYKKFLIENIK